MTKTDWQNLSPKNIIVRMPNWVGDLTMATPILADLCRHWPEAKLTAMCQLNVAPLLKYDPHIDELFAFQKPSGWIPHKSTWDLINNLRKGKYDLGVLLTNSFSSAWWYWIGNVKNRVGFSGNARSLLLDKAVPFPKKRKEQHLVVTYKELLTPIGIPVSTTEPTLYTSQEERSGAKDLFARCGIDPVKDVIIGINPGAAFGTAKCWIPERFRALALRLIERRNTRVIFFGDFASAPLVNEICKDLPEKVVNLASKTTLRELLACIQQCTLFVSNDSGPMHIAAALKTPVLGLFGSTDDTISRPYGIGRVINKRVDCSPCHKKICPIDFRCMTRITVDEVYDQVAQMLVEKGK